MFDQNLETKLESNTDLSQNTCNERVESCIWPHGTGESYILIGAETDYLTGGEFNFSIFDRRRSRRGDACVPGLARDENRIHRRHDGGHDLGIRIAVELLQSLN